MVDKFIILCKKKKNKQACGYGSDFLQAVATLLKLKCFDVTRSLGEC